MMILASKKEYYYYFGRIKFSLIVFYSKHSLHISVDTEDGDSQLDFGKTRFSYISMPTLLS